MHSTPCLPTFYAPRPPLSPHDLPLPPWPCTNHHSSRCGAPATFLLQFSAPDSGFDNYYANFEAYGDDNDSWTVYADPSANSAAEFSMTKSCALGQNGLAYIADIPSSGPPSGIWFDTPGNIQNSGYVTPTCSVTDGALSCDFDGSRNFALCPNGQDVGQTSAHLTPVSTFDT